MSNYGLLKKDDISRLTTGCLKYLHISVVFNLKSNGEPKIIEKVD